LRYADAVIVDVAAVHPFFKNGFVIGCEDTRQGAIIDPGDEVEDLLAAAARHRLTITQILLTHAHLDHITGVGRAKRVLGVPVWLHRDDNFLYERVVEQGRMFGFDVEPQPPVDHFYEAEGPLRMGRYAIRVLHTPGHCPGGVCLAVRKDSEAPGNAEEPSTLFVGDTLFAGSIGRTDLPGGDANRLLDSIRRVLFAFPDDSVVWSGHGPATTIGHERRTNPFLV
jgi:glyoxylase-like metal-dependent hydrolase (beta-lactamase superfamily II)